MKSQNQQQCTRCLMDTSDPEIHFDENGYCNHCVDYFNTLKNLTYQGKKSDDELEKIVEKIKASGKNQTYDCVIGVSGGIDSSYVAYLTKKLGLKPLAVHMDNGWNSELAVSNIEKLLNQLNIDLYTHVLDWDEFKDLQLSFLKASIPEIETPTDMAIPAVLHQVAAKHNIKHIISGGNYATEGILPKSWHYDRKDVTFLKAIQQQFGTKKLKTFPTFGYQKEIYYKFVKGIRFVYMLNYVPFSKKDAVELLEKELNWKYYGGKHFESRFTKLVQAYILPEKFNIDYRKSTYSTQICAGEVTREEVIDELQLKPHRDLNLTEEIEYFCKKLNISLSDFDNMMKEKPKSYSNYPNNQAFLEFLYKTYQRYF
ncbi:MAG: N-acetyl sugar amidotransferase [Flavobacteriales bacterium]|nr:N-acetyl sugar amidotransferase [Flavobacteriales bacterium]MCW8912414.1 N-acetyl sugar amidotransferase [Flavobacteriales bacterium]MCW8936498.1 N-acetyl sugar amidotransferase [Flavobacteriales bacterium]MCW8940706.1 N-acetyl sugar amidotransferase [Flavobacteriales bacterium]MCW8989553.1 N-acetyl sugar amidotransferase [Flavobacteriales bacterium]